MGKIIKAKRENGEIIYGILSGYYELIIDDGAFYPTCTPLYFDSMKTVSGDRYAVEVQNDGSFLATIPDGDFTFHEGHGHIATVEYGIRGRKRGRHSMSNNRMANRLRIISDELPF